MAFMRKSKLNSVQSGAAIAAAAPRATASAVPRISQRAHLARRLAAQERMEREAALGEAFDFLKCGDCFELLCSIGAAEVMTAGAVGAAIPIPLYAAGMAFTLALAASVLALAQIGAGMALWAIMKFLSCFNRRVKRPVYYPVERLRREKLARARRKIRQRRTLNACPTKEELEAQFAKAKSSPREMIRFGSMICDLECYVDNSLVRNECGEIIGRKPGIRGWLNENCPRLGAKYKTLMRYKTMAEKLKQAVGVTDPIPAAMLAETDENTVRKLLAGEHGDGRRCALGVSQWEMAAAWGKAQDFFRVCYRFQTDVIAQLDLRLAPEFAPSGWSMKSVSDSSTA